MFSYTDFSFTVAFKQQEHRGHKDSDVPPKTYTRSTLMVGLLREGQMLCMVKLIKREATSQQAAQSERRRRRDGSHCGHRSARGVSCSTNVIYDLSHPN